MKTVFFGTPGFATPFLKALIDDPDTEVVAVVCQPDKPSGRGNKMTAPAVKILAQDSNIPVLQPKSLKREEVCEELKSLDAGVFVVVAYGKLIPQNVLDLPKMGCVNVHPSLLPKYRGPSPMQWSILEGDEKTGVSVMVLDAGMDTGPILGTEEIDLDNEETYETLTHKVHEKGPSLLTQTLHAYTNGDVSPVDQGDEDVSVTRLLTREDGLIDWNLPAQVIHRKVRAYLPWPSAWCTWKRDDGSEIRLKIIRATVCGDDHENGVVFHVDSQLIVGCGEGSLVVLEIQPEGKPKMKAEAFMNGYQDFVGSRL